MGQPQPPSLGGRALERRTGLASTGGRGTWPWRQAATVPRGSAARPGGRERSRLRRCRAVGRGAAAVRSAVITSSAEASGMEWERASRAASSFQELRGDGHVEPGLAGREGLDRHRAGRCGQRGRGGRWQAQFFGAARFVQANQIHPAGARRRRRRHRGSPDRNRVHDGAGGRRDLRAQLGGDGGVQGTCWLPFSSCQPLGVLKRYGLKAANQERKPGAQENRSLRNEVHAAHVVAPRSHAPAAPARRKSRIDGMPGRISTGRSEWSVSRCTTSAAGQARA